MTQWSYGKMAVLLGLIIIYGFVGVIVKVGSDRGLLEKIHGPLIVTTEPRNDSNSVDKSLRSSMYFVDQVLTKENGHVDLSPMPGIPEGNYTNSEAISYALLWNAKGDRKEEFDHQLEFLQKFMIHPTHGYIRWKLTDLDAVQGDGDNVASDADLRSILALKIANEKWPDAKYDEMIDKLALGLEKTAITADKYLAPYGGSSGTSTWTASEVWISYEDFQVLKYLAEKRKEPWTTVYANMKAATLRAQLENGLYNSVLTQARAYGNHIDAGDYSINSLWIMVRSAESGDPQLEASASRGLRFYQDKFAQDKNLYASYRSDGIELSKDEAPWVYALVARAAIALEQEDFASAMMQKLLSFQDRDVRSSRFGAFIEGGQKPFISQFTQQESILTMQDYLQDYPTKSFRLMLLDDDNVDYKGEVLP